MKKYLVLAIISIFVAAIFAATPRVYTQVLVTDQGELLPGVTNTSATHHPDYYMEVFVTARPTEVISTTTHAAAQIKIYRYGAGTVAVPYATVASYTLAPFPTQWVPGEILRTNITHIPTGETSTWDCPIPTGTTAWGHRQPINPFPFGIVAPPYSAELVYYDFEVTSTPAGATIWIDSVASEFVAPHTFSLLEGTSALYSVAMEAYTWEPETYEIVNITANGSIEFIGTPLNLIVNSTPPGYAILKDGVPTGEITPHTFSPGGAGTYTLAERVAYAWDPASYTVGELTEDTTIHFTSYIIVSNAATEPSPLSASIYAYSNQLNLEWSYYQNEDYAQISYFKLYLPSVERDYVVIPFVEGQTRYSYSVSELSFFTDYFWKVVPVSVWEQDCLESETWTFSTIPEAPMLDLSDNLLDFYQVDIGATVSKNVVIRNLGFSDLDIYGILSTSPRYSYTVIDGSLPHTIAYLDSLVIQINYSPTAVQQNNAFLYITSNDPTNGNLAVINLMGSGYNFICDFSGTPNGGDVPLLVQFTSLANGVLLDAVWDFGDGNTSHELNPSHVYEVAGVYSVSFSVSDNWTRKTRLKTDYINAVGHALIGDVRDKILFPGIYLEDTSSDSLITITNTGTLALEISDVYLSEGSTAFHFDLSSFQNPLPIGASSTIPVSFIPTTSGVHRDSLIIINNSENNPRISIFIRGSGLYVPPSAPENVSINMNGSHAILSWDPVSTNIYGTPLTPDLYVILFNGSDIEEEDRYYFLATAVDTTFTHAMVGLYSEHMYYKIVSIKSYRSEQVHRELQRIMNSEEKKKWTDIQAIIHGIEQD